MKNNNVIANRSVEKIVTDWGSLQWLVTGAAGNSENLTVGRVTFNVGKSNPRHYHPNCEEVLYVESGTVEHTLPDGGSVVLEKGDCIVVPQGVWHQATNIGDEEAVVVVTFNNAYRETVGE
ncbi:cupin domain-containing protein [Lederbergia graminis]|uniref:Cupin domain-containing protein n=1 Tax=Lederbergia graminis TaxID=735518 RepID=A0ABW0LEA9_9BACI|nr:cupin domain-containing protein [Paenibacillus bovis]HLU22094.1 cupin domain-containing protein [Bacillaceae bacterium]